MIESSFQKISNCLKIIWPIWLRSISQRSIFKWEYTTIRQNAMRLGLGSTSTSTLLALPGVHALVSYRSFWNAFKMLCIHLAMWSLSDLPLPLLRTLLQDAWIAFVTLENAKIKGTDESCFSQDWPIASRRKLSSLAKLQKLGRSAGWRCKTGFAIFVYYCSFGSLGHKVSPALLALMHFCIATRVRVPSRTLIASPTPPESFEEFFVCQKRLRDVILSARSRVKIRLWIRTGSMSKYSWPSVIRETCCKKHFLGSPCRTRSAAYLSWDAMRLRWTNFSQVNVLGRCSTEICPNNSWQMRELIAPPFVSGRLIS